MQLLKSIIVFLGFVAIVVAGCSEELTAPEKPEAFDEDILTREDLKSESMAKDDVYSLIEDLPEGGGKATLQVLDNDRGTGLRIASCDCASTLGRVTIEKNTLVLSIDADVSGIDELEYVAVSSDSFSTARVVIEILPFNDAPIANQDSLHMNLAHVGDSTSRNIASLFSDVEESALTYKLQPSETVNTIVIDPTGPTLRITAKVSGPESVDLIALDDSLKESQPVTILIMVGNRPPVNSTPLPSLDLFVGQSETVNLADHFEDPDGNPLTYSATSGSNLELTLVGESLTVKALSEANEAVEISASDGVDSIQTTMMVNVSSNESPEFILVEGLAVNKREMTSLTAQDLFLDDLGAQITLEIIEGFSTDLATAEISNGSLVLLSGSEAGTDSLTIAGFDGLTSGEGVLVVNIVNREPERTPTQVLTLELVHGIDTTLNISEMDLFSDPDGDTLRFRLDLTTNPDIEDFIAFDQSGPLGEVLNLDPQERPGQVVFFKIFANDGDDSTTTFATFPVDVKENQPPTIKPGSDTLFVFVGDTLETDLTNLFENEPRDTLVVGSVTEIPDGDSSITILSGLNELPVIRISGDVTGVDKLGIQVKDGVNPFANVTIFVRVVEAPGSAGLRSRSD